MRTDPAGLLDREREFAAVDRLLARARAGNGELLVVTGGAGVGKTALLDAAAGRARRAGFVVLTAAGSPVERDLRLGLACSLFEPTRRQPGGDVARDQDGDPCGKRAARQGTATDAEMRALHEGLTRLASRTAVLVVVDEVQWADRASLHWLATLPRRVKNAPIALIVSVGDGEPSVDPALLDELLAGSAHESHPAGLGASAAAALLEDALGTAPDPAFAAACLEATGGNPLLLTTLASALAREEIAPVSDRLAAVADVAVPRLASKLHSRLRRVSPHALGVARGVAVLGGDAELDRLSDLTGTGLTTVGEVTAAMRRMGLLHLDGPRVSFTQSLVARTIARETPYGTLRTARAQAARLLHRTGAPCGRVAEQLLAAPPLAEPWVPVVLADAAAAVLAEGDPATAIGYLRRALAESVPPEIRVRLLIDLGRAEGRVDVSAAIRHLTEAYDGVTDLVTREGLVDELAALLAVTGRDEAAVAMLESGGRRTAADRTPTVTELQLRRAATAPAVVARLDRLRGSGRDRDTAGRDLSGLLAERESWAGRSRAAAVAYAQRVFATAPHGPGDVPTYLRAVTVLAHAGLLAPAYERCTALVDTVIRWRHQPCQAAALSARSTLARRLGRLPAAVDDARTGLDLLVGSGVGRRSDVAVGYAARLVHVLVDVGDLDEAAGLLELGGVTADVPATWSGVRALLARGRLRVAAGHPAEGAADLLEAGQRLATWDAANPAVAPWRSAAALALTHLNDHTRARRYAAGEVALARRWGAGEPLARALRVTAAVEPDRPDLGMLQEAVSLLADSPARLELAHCLSDYGAALRLAGDPARARPVLHEALEVAGECQVPPLVDRVRAELAAAGGRPARKRRAGAAGLTPSERRVVAMAVRGRSNREIAESLYVRQRTVEIHLTNAYRKLGIDGRDDLALALHGSAGGRVAGRVHEAGVRRSLVGVR